MYALRAYDQSSPQLRYEEMPVPSPGTGDVLLEVDAASITPTELMWPSTWVDRAGRDRTPAVPGHEVSGTVRELGYGATGLAIGDHVYGLTDWYRDGAAADFVAVEARNVARKPSTVTHVEAAALPMAGLTAWQALFEHGGLKSGQTVVINGASGGVGTVAIQLARSAGVRVIAVARNWALGLLTDLGVDGFVDADDLDASEVRNADLLFDLVGGDFAVRCARMVGQGGVVVSVVNAPPRMSNAQGLFFVVEPDRAQLDELARLVDKGQVKPVVGKVVDLTQDASNVFAIKEHGRIPGKVVLRTERSAPTGLL